MARILFRITSLRRLAALPVGWCIWRNNDKGILESGFSFGKYMGAKPSRHETALDETKMVMDWSNDSRRNESTRAHTATILGIAQKKCAQKCQRFPVDVGKVWQKFLSFSKNEKLSNFNVPTIAIESRMGFSLIVLRICLVLHTIRENLYKNDCFPIFLSQAKLEICHSVANCIWQHNIYQSTFSSRSGCLWQCMWDMVFSI